jgi:hypothetical protein
LSKDERKDCVFNLERLPEGGINLRFRYMSEKVTRTSNRMVNPRSPVDPIQFQFFLGSTSTFCSIATPNFLVFFMTPKNILKFLKHEHVFSFFIKKIKDRNEVENWS